MKSDAELVPTPGADAREAPIRLLVVQGEARPAVDVAEEPLVMTFPHLLIRELIALLAASLVLVALALCADAPLEEIANPLRTPNPAKAPWYFLGLQELLHYYPPVVSGVLLPGLVVVALAVIPYFRINLERSPLWLDRVWPKLGALWVVVTALTAVFALTGAHPVWPIIGPLWVVAITMTAGAFLPGEGSVSRWLRTRSVAFWIFFWFLLAAAVLTVVGVFFRGPGWSFTLPWRDGIFY
ncbi:MAG: hypothetical protein HYY06_21600 [Deltaproteobacteria bacterium]|nr:hypothetical protein [Deltaproteobacteria bacterium]